MPTEFELTVHMWWNTIKVGIKNLMLHKLRSLLTVLGVILGAGSVIAMLAIGEGSKREALEQIRQLGANNIIIRSVKPGQGGGSESSTTSTQQQNMVLEYGLQYTDLERLKATMPTITDAIPICPDHTDRLARRATNSQCANSGDHAGIPTRQERSTASWSFHHGSRPLQHGQCRRSRGRCSTTLVPIQGSDRTTGVARRRCLSSHRRVGQPKQRQCHARGRSVSKT